MIRLERCPTIAVWTSRRGNGMQNNRRRVDLAADCSRLVRRAYRGHARLRDVIMLVAVDVSRDAVLATIEVGPFPSCQMAAIVSEIAFARSVDVALPGFEVSSATGGNLAAGNTLADTALLTRLPIANGASVCGEREQHGERACQDTV